MSNHEFDICIIGAGVAGGAMASYLADTNLRIVVIDKNWEEQDRIIGELLQPGGVQQLEKMNLKHTTEGLDAQPVIGYGLFLNGDSFKIEYPVKDTNLTGLGFRNGMFVQNLRENLKKYTNITCIKGSVKTTIEENNKITGVVYENENGEEISIRAKLTIGCDGPLGGLRLKYSKSTKKINGYFLGLVLENCDLPYANHGHVIITDDSTALMYPITSTQTRMLIDFPGEQPPRPGDELKNHLRNSISKHIPKSTIPSFLNAVEEGKFKMFPNHHLPANPIFKEGFALVGDSLNMRHPLTGGGMTVAFTDIYHLGTNLKSIRDWNNPSEINAAVKEFYETRHTDTGTINILADALYGVMKSHDLRDACYGYLHKGGKYASEPISILSAISRDKTLLQNHFFAVAWFGAKKVINHKPTPKRLKRGYLMMRDAVNIISPLLMQEKPSAWMRTVLKTGKLVFG